MSFIELTNKLRKVQNIVYSILVKGGFESAGPGFFIEYPSRIIGGRRIKIGRNFYCFGRLRLEAHEKHNKSVFTPEIIIGNGVSLNFDCHIACVNKIVIGDGVLIASRVFITDHFHGDTTVNTLSLPPSALEVTSKGPVIIEDNVWIGEGACIMPNVTIGKNSIVGANSVVTKTFPENSVIGGVPAKLIKTIR